MVGYGGQEQYILQKEGGRERAEEGYELRRATLSTRVLPSTSSALMTSVAQRTELWRSSARPRRQRRQRLGCLSSGCRAHATQPGLILTSLGDFTPVGLCLGKVYLAHVTACCSLRELLCSHRHEV
jgi:hypothetical protein